MPLDGHTYLASYGWSGKGTGLRSGAIDKPLAIPPKRNLSGIGKDRDEAFPFWDHLYSAATKAITIKIADDDDDGEDEDENEDTSAALPLKRTATGIISNRRPISGTPASGTSTPDSDAYPSASVITIAKREAARKGLYSRFFRGPVLAPDVTSNSTTPTSSPLHSADHTLEGQSIPQIDIASTKESRKRTSSQLLETREERRERKRLKRERREKKAAKKAAKTANQKPSLQDSLSKDDRTAQKALTKKLADNAGLQKPPLGGGVFASSRIIDVPQFDDPDEIERKKRKKRKRMDS